MTKKILYISGMHCGSCEFLIEGKFRKIPGVKHVTVRQSEGTAEIFVNREIAMEEFERAIAAHGYHVLSDRETADACSITVTKNTKRDYLQMGAVLIIILGLYLFLKETKLFNFNINIADDMGYGLVFLVGLVAASSTCIAVTGGVLLSVVGKHQEQLAGVQDVSRFQKFKPHLWFNIGRILSYAMLGGLIGLLGKAISFSPKTTGIITLAAAIFMILMGLRMLNLFPKISRFSLRMPKFISRRIITIEGKQGKTIPFMAGALTFFLPCGFTQAFQLYAMSRGSFTEGALTMFFFSLGTLPALLSLGALSSFTKGAFYKLFLKFSGVLVLILGFYNIGNGFALTGNPLSFTSLLTNAASTAETQTKNPNVRLENDTQVVSMKITSRGYTPNRFTIKQGVPVRWEINGIDVYGCQSVLMLPSYGITKFIDKGKNVIEFMPKEAGILPFSCSMGMFRGAFTVTAATSCDPKIMDCKV